MRSWNSSTSRTRLARWAVARTSGSVRSRRHRAVDLLVEVHHAPAVQLGLVAGEDLGQPVDVAGVLGLDLGGRAQAEADPAEGLQPGGGGVGVGPAGEVDQPVEDAALVRLVERVDPALAAARRGEGTPAGEDGQAEGVERADVEAPGVAEALPHLVGRPLVVGDQAEGTGGAGAGPARRWRARSVRVRVLPEPAGEMTRQGPPRWATAASWSAARSAAGGSRPKGSSSALLQVQDGEQRSAERAGQLDVERAAVAPGVAPVGQGDVRRSRTARRRRPSARDRGAERRARRGPGGRRRWPSTRWTSWSSGKVKSGASRHGSAGLRLGRALGQVDGQLDHVPLAAGSTAAGAGADHLVGRRSRCVDHDPRGARPRRRRLLTGPHDQRPPQRVGPRQHRRAPPPPASTPVLAPDSLRSGAGGSGARTTGLGRRLVDRAVVGARGRVPVQERTSATVSWRPPQCPHAMAIRSGRYRRRGTLSG